MKKIFFIVLVALVSSVAVVSCTEESIIPVENVDGDAGNGGVQPGPGKM